MSRVVLASANEAKLKELQEILAPLELELVPQTRFNVTNAVENGQSFVENAIIKARHAAMHTGLPAIADDSGLEVDALNGEPGVYSARYAGDREDRDSNDAANNELLLEKLKQVPEAERRARFQCAIALFRFNNDPMPLICQGSWEGRIAVAERGDKGFGYDPLFFVPEYQCTSAELDPEVKNSISHRAKAVRELLKRWPL